MATLIEQNNHVENLLTGVGFYLWTDGKIGGYVRYVADGQRFGWRDELVKRAYLPHIMASGALPMAKSGSFAGRPDARVPGLDGLYLAGDWVGAEGFLIDASMASARQASSTKRCTWSCLTSGLSRS